MIVNENRYFRFAVESLIQDEAFKNIRLVLILDGKDTDNKKYCNYLAKKYPQVSVLEEEGRSVAQMYNDALDIADAEYVNFTYSSSVYGKGSLGRVIDYFKAHDKKVLMAHTRFIEDPSDLKEKIKRSDAAYDFNKETVNLPLFLNRYFIKNDPSLIGRFSLDIPHEAECDFLFNLLIKLQGETFDCPKSVLVNYAIAQENNSTLFADQYNKWWYTDSIKNIILPKLKELSKNKPLSKFMSNLALYFISRKYLLNENMLYKYIISKDEVDSFYQSVKEALKYIPDEYILDIDNKTLSKQYLKYTFFLIKHDDVKITRRKNAGHYVFELNGIPFISDDKILVSRQSYEKIADTHALEIKCELFFNYLFQNNGENIRAYVNNKEVEVKIEESKGDISFFGRKALSKLFFVITIPKTDRSLFNKYRFSVSDDGEEVEIKSAMAHRKILGNVKREIKNSRLCPYFQRLNKAEYIFYYDLAKITTKVNPKQIAMISDSRDHLSGNFEFIDNELKKHDYDVKYFFKKNLKARKTKAEKKELCKLIAESKYVLVDDFYPIIYALKLRKSTRLIQVWHAMGAFKTVGFSRLGKPGGPNPRSISHKGYTAAITSGEGIRHNYAEAFNMPVEKVYATGIPRTDCFFDSAYIAKTKERIYCKYPVLKNKKVVLFAPTFRGNGQNSAHYNFDWIDFASLKKELSDEYIFIVKLHPFIKNIDAVPKNDNFFIDMTSEREINDLLFVTDVLITDYSSVIFEASLLDITTIFYVPDLEEYTRSRDFYYPFDTYTFGEVAENMDELIYDIKHAQNDENKVKMFKERFSDACDGHATARLVKELIVEDK